MDDDDDNAGFEAMDGDTPGKTDEVDSTLPIQVLKVQECHPNVLLSTTPEVADTVWDHVEVPEARSRSDPISGNFRSFNAVVFATIFSKRSSVMTSVL